MPPTTRRKAYSEELDVEHSEEELDAPGLVHELEVATGGEDDEMVVDEYADSSAESEGRSEDSRSEGELEDMQLEMQELERNVNLTGVFKLVDRLGEGTFSSVYKAIDCHHNLYDNSKWCPPDNYQLPTPDPSSDQGQRRKKGRIYVALKRIYVTSSPQRIQNELDILGRLRDCDNVAYLISAFRHEDQVIAVMPYEKHQDFRDYYRRRDMKLIRNYFWCMLKGLEGAHARGIIHRDLKPANFLFNMETGWGAVCDFGLAQIFDPVEWKGFCLHSLPLPNVRGREHGVQLERPLSAYDQANDAVERWGDGALDLQNQPDLLEQLEDRIYEDGDFYATWDPATKPKPGHKVGYLKPELDKRPSAKANRAGTRGFRAPEVLFKCSDQTVSIDIWSVGITLLCFLTGRFPFFNSNDDTEALMEIACIFGKRRMEQCGALHNRVFITNVPSAESGFRKNLHELVRALNPAFFKEQRPKDTQPDDLSWYEKSDLYQAVDLMKHCLNLDCTRRVTAHDALSHPFFRDFEPPRQAYS